MDKKRIKRKLHAILDTTPELKEIMLSDSDLEAKRQKVRLFLSAAMTSKIDKNTKTHALEWVLARDAIESFNTILSTRSERLTNHSFFQYLDDLLNKDDLRNIEKPSSGFFAELDHLLKGIVGETGVYSDKIPAFLKHRGARAAKLRSSDLSRMARRADKFLNLYPSGLDRNIIRRRSLNKSRILKYFNATELEWKDWRWHTKNIIRNADTLKALVELTEQEYEAVKTARENRIPFGITPYYLSLMDYGSNRERDYAVRAQVIPSLHYVNRLKENKNNPELSMDFMLEKNTSPIEGITRRYPMIVILKPILTCPQICVYCQRNWEIEDVYSTDAALSKEKLDKAIQWIADTEEIREVLITGGDPFLLSNRKLESILSRISRIKHVERIRIGTRTPVTLPHRVTDALARSINRFHVPGKRELIIVTHFEHPYEVTPQSMEAVQKFRRYGIEVCNQLVYTFYNSKKFEAAALRLKLRLIGVTPYYTFNTKGKDETDDFRVPIPRLLQEQKEEARLLPGTARTDEIVFNVPGLGKNYLRAVQHRDFISIMPDGSRVYEFHPWEKSLALADTYIYKDVPIWDYLKQLKKAGEDISQYKSIWSYY